MNRLPKYILMLLVTTQVWTGVAANMPYVDEEGIMATPTWDAKIYPNPNNGSFTIMIVDNRSVIEVAVFNVIGEQVFELTVLGDHGARFELGHLEKGLYFVQLSDKGKGEVLTRRMHVR